MSNLLPIVLFLAGFLGGAILVWIFRASDTRALREALANRDAKLDRLQDDFAELRSERATLETQLAGERRSSAERTALLETAEQTLSDAFKALSADALRSNNQSFLELAKSQLEKFQESAQGDLDKRQQVLLQTLQPVRESLEKVDAKIQELEKNRTGAYAALHEQVKALTDGQTALRSETTNLVRALRQPTVRGRWGEIQLKRVVEMAGMLNHCDFFEQQTVSTDEGRIRPDVRVCLPGNKYIIIDAKTPLEAYLNAVETADETERRDFLRIHAQNVRTHIMQLSKKSYWEQFSGSPEFVVLFLPGESFFSAALESDPSLIEFGVEHHIITATPTTLIGLLRAIHYGWQQEHVAAEARQISDLGKELYTRLAGMTEHFFNLRKNLTNTVDSYNKAVGSLEGRVLVTARKFRDMRALGLADEIEQVPQVESAPRMLQAPELTILPGGLFPVPPASAVEDQAGEFEDGTGAANRDAIADLSSAMPAPLFAETGTPPNRNSSSDRT